MKSRIMKSFFIASAFVLTINSAVLGQNLKEKQNEIEERIDDAREELKDKADEKKTLLEEINELDKGLVETTEKFEELEKQLGETKGRLEESEKELKDAQVKREAQFKALQERVVIIYEYGDTGYLDILLNAEGFSDFFRRLEYLNYIMEYDNDILKKYQETEDFISKKVNQIKVEKENVQVLTNQAAEEKYQLEQKKAEKEKHSETIAKDETKLREQLADLERESNNIKNLINGTSVTATGSSSNKVYPGTGGQLAHPVPQYSGAAYNDVFRSRQSPISGRWEKHTGLDMKATYGTDIVSAEDGVVTYSGFNNGGYGYMVIIDHGGGMSTLYAHNSSLSVKKGQSVSRGQVIAKAGSTGYSTGVHAHFEVRINGTAVDPAPYLR